MNIEERRLQARQWAEQRASQLADRKHREDTLLAEITELAAQVLQYGLVLTMADKVQTPAQRRAHEPIGQSKRWSATCTIAGMTETEFAIKFNVHEDMRFKICDHSVWHYTQKQALASHAETCTEEFIRLMSVLSWLKPEIYTQITTTLKAGK